MTDRPGTKPRARWARLGLACLAAAALAGCAGAAPRLARGELGSVYQTAPRLASFRFDGAPLAPADAFGPWAALTAQSGPDARSLEACLADKAVCATPDLVRFRRMMELAAGLAPREQLSLVHHYFNQIEWTNDTRDTWSTLYHTAFSRMGDCEDIAIAKYQALRRLGWRAEDLRVLVGWDGEENDWHALLAVRLDGDTLVLDSVKGLQSPALLSSVRLVYSISEHGVWDHAPDFVPVGREAERRLASERAARLAATERRTNQGVLR
jgi:predicted transglutaminase-like cysteine proteinase